MVKQLLIIDNDDQSAAIERIHAAARTKPFTVNCTQFNVGLPDGNDVVDANGKIDMALVREKYEREFGSRKFHLIAFDFKLNDTTVDGVTLIKQFNSIGKTRKASKMLYSSELTEIVQEYLNEYRDKSDYDSAWGKFKTLINLEILDFCKREDYESKAVQFLDKISENDNDIILGELRGSKDLFFNAAIEVYNGLTLDEIADKIEGGDPEVPKFKKKLIELAIANLSELKDEE
ncbi:MAG: hypothetical protein H3C64_04165 [Candidatus Kuenenia stuttgartiensis]|nr:hypothetical protein [Candidatus Kuenenia stuttgartiensis]